MHIRWLIRRDMAEVLSIDEQGFAEPWDEEGFRRWLRTMNCIGMVVQMPDESIAGFMVYELHKFRLNLLRMAVAPQRRRQGVGRAMLDKLEHKLRTGRTSITATVPERDLPAQLFFRACGWRATGIDHEDETIRFRFTIKSEVTA